MPVCYRCRKDINTRNTKSSVSQVTRKRWYCGKCYLLNMKEKRSGMVAYHKRK